MPEAQHYAILLLAMKLLSFLRTNQKLVLQVALSFLFIGLGIYFLRHEEAEVKKVVEAISQANGWWVLIGLIPIIGGIWLLIELGFLKGTDGPNRFGPPVVD